METGVIRPLSQLRKVFVDNNYLAKAIIFKYLNCHNFKVVAIHNQKLVV